MTQTVYRLKNEKNYDNMVNFFMYILKNPCDREYYIYNYLLINVKCKLYVSFGQMVGLHTICRKVKETVNGARKAVLAFALN